MMEKYQISAWQPCMRALSLTAASRFADLIETQKFSQEILCETIFACDSSALLSAVREWKLLIRELKNGTRRYGIFIRGGATGNFNQNKISLNVGKEGEFPYIVVMYDHTENKDPTFPCFLVLKMSSAQSLSIWKPANGTLDFKTMYTKEKPKEKDSPSLRELYLSGRGMMCFVDSGIFVTEEQLMNMILVDGNMKYIQERYMVTALYSKHLKKINPFLTMYSSFSDMFRVLTKDEVHMLNQEWCQNVFDAAKKAASCEKQKSLPSGENQNTTIFTDGSENEQDDKPISKKRKNKQKHTGGKKTNSKPPRRSERLQRLSVQEDDSGTNSDSDTLECDRKTIRVAKRFIVSDDESIYGEFSTVEVDAEDGMESYDDGDEEKLEEGEYVDDEEDIDLLDDIDVEDIPPELKSACAEYDNFLDALQHNNAFIKNKYTTYLLPKFGHVCDEDKDQWNRRICASIIALTPKLLEEYSTTTAFVSGNHHCELCGIQNRTSKTSVPILLPEFVKHALNPTFDFSLNMFTGVAAGKICAKRFEQSVSYIGAFDSIFSQTSVVQTLDSETLVLLYKQIMDLETSLAQY